MSEAEHPAISMAALRSRIAGMDLGHHDAVVGILRGGRVPALVAAEAVGTPLRWLRISYRDDDHRPLRPEPRLQFSEPMGIAQGSRVLLVDDVAVSGATIQIARTALEGLHVTTMVLKGTADHVVFPEIEGCVRWPWNDPERAPSPDEPGAMAGIEPMSSLIPEH